MSEERKDPIKFKLDQPVEGKFVFDSPLTGTSKGKEGEDFTWYMYKFEDKNGNEEVFFPSTGLQKQLAELGNIKDKKFKITKVLFKDEDGNTKEDKQGRPMTTFEVETEGSAEEVFNGVTAEEAGIDQL